MMITLELFLIWITLLSGIAFIEGDVIFIEPRKLPKYLGDDLTLTCHHSVNLARPMWVANGTLLNDRSNTLNDFVTFVDNPAIYGFSLIIIHNMTKDINETEIYCFSENSEYSIPSNNFTILLQGKLETVGSLEFQIDERDLLITWSPPFSLNVTNSILYNIEILNKTSMNVTIFSSHLHNFIKIQPSPSRLITCDDFDITVTPMNKLGCGIDTTLNITSGALLDANASAVLSDYEQKLDLLVGVTSFLCSITNIRVKNVNLNITTSMKTFNDFKLLDNSVKTPHYLLTLEMEERLFYEIEMTLNNDRGNLTKKFKITTHEIESVEIDERDGQIQASLTFSSRALDSNGVFMMLLNCQNQNCNSFHYNQSIFLSIVGGVETVTYDKGYYSGYYKSFAYDTLPNGYIRPSGDLINITYPVSSPKFQLSFGSGEILSDGHCSYQHNNESLSSTCNTSTVKQSRQQQLVQIEYDFDQGQYLVISSLYPLNESACIKINQKTETEYIISVVVTPDYSLEIEEPIGKYLISTKGYSDNVQGCPKSYIPPTTPPSKENEGRILGLGLGFGLGAGLPIVITAITIVVFVIKCWKRRNYDNISRFCTK